MVKHFIWHR